MAIAPYTGPSKPQFQLGRRLGVIGTSLVQQNDVATSAKISHWNRGWLSWARFFAAGRFECHIWHDPTVYVGWEPSQVVGATRSFRGLNAGVSGQTAAMIDARKAFLAESVKCDIIVIDSGTNDMGPLSKEDIQTYRENLAKYYLDKGITVIFLPILSRAVSSWASGSDMRKKASWINSKTRQFCQVNRNCHFVDWNSTWVDPASADGEPRALHSSDGIHFAPAGGVSVGELLANFLAKILPDPMPRVWSQDDKYDATFNPFGNLMANPFTTGTAGTHGTGSSGVVATGMRSERSTGDATVVTSKETRADGRGDWQVLTYTPSTTSSLFYFRQSTADTTHSLPAGTWVQASIEVDIGAFNAWEGVTLYLKDFGVNGLIGYGMETFDEGGFWKLPNRNLRGLIVTPPFQIVSGSTTLRWRLEVKVGSTGGGATGTGVLKAGALELRPVQDPRTIVEYVTGS